MKVRVDGIDWRPNNAYVSGCGKFLVAMRAQDASWNCYRWDGAGGNWQRVRLGRLHGGGFANMKDAMRAMEIDAERNREREEHNNAEEQGPAVPTS
jgi:hypothetical protein